ncbi:hypothetical protein BT96DRAFT_1008910 [Gymnopus androsaceus JB14]|uniref:Uncharacterized protein n=1 Tax=Gymnopus androsaceus JB14 TaxID=1447944 RepID=A0A6A4GDN1_9AGAR|nr:hypothetical protein BT96DRAFT_1008910 [Gymnopus androsaceus JB14]
MPPKRSPSPSDASPRKRTKRSPPPNPSPSSPPSPHSVAPDASLPAPISTVSPAPWQTATSAEIDEALKSIFQLGGQFVVDVSDDQWRGIAKRLNSCVRCEGKSELCSAAGGTELVCDACQWAHKRCSLGIAYQYHLFANQFHAPLSWARQDPPLSSPVSRRPSAMLLALLVLLLLLQIELVLRVVVVSPLGYSYEPRTPGSQSSPRKVVNTAGVVVPKPPTAPSSTDPNPSFPPSRGVRVVRGPTICIPPPARRPAPPNRSPSPPIPLRVGDVVIPPGSDLAQELAAFEATEAQVETASCACFFKQQEDARIAAAKTKRCLEAEQQRKEKRVVKTHWKDDMREREQAEKDTHRRQKKSQREQAEKDARCQQKTLAAQQQQHRQVPSSSSRDLDSQVTRARPSAPSPPPIRNSPRLSPAEHTSIPPEFSPLSAPAHPFLEHSSSLPRRTRSPPRFHERPGLDGDAYCRAHAAVASGRDPTIADLQDAYGDSHRLDFPHLVHWEPLPQMPILRNNNVGALQQELLDMQRRLNSAQLDLETERARNRMSVVQTQHLEAQLADLRRLNSEQECMLKNRQVEYDLLEGEVRALADSAAASTASAAQAKAYKLLVVPGYPDPTARIEDLEGVLARYEVELRKSEEGRGVAVDRAIRREVKLGNTSQLIHDLLGTCEHLRQRERSAEDSASSLRESNLDLIAQLGGSYSLEGASETNAILRTEVERYHQELSQLSNAFHRLESARPASFLAEVARRVEYLVQQIRSSLLHGRTDPEAYEHAEEAGECLRLHLRECLSRMEQSLTFLLRVAGRYREGVAPLVDQYSTVDPASLLSLAEYAGLVVPSHADTHRPLYPLLPFDTSQPLGCAPPSDSLRHIFFLPLLSCMRVDARDLLLRAQLQTCIEDNKYWEHLEKFPSAQEHIGCTEVPTG